MKPFIKIVLLPALLLATACNNTYSVNVFFDNVEGLQEKSEVIANGVSVGEVEEMALHKNGVVVTLSINKKHKIPVNSTFKLFEPALMSYKKIEITTGKGDKFLKDGDTVKTVFYKPYQKRFEIEDLVHELVEENKQQNKQK